MTFVNYGFLLMLALLEMNLISSAAINEGNCGEMYRVHNEIINGEEWKE